VFLFIRKTNAKGCELLLFLDDQLALAVGGRQFVRPASVRADAQASDHGLSCAVTRTSPGLMAQKPGRNPANHSAEDDKEMPAAGRAAGRSRQVCG
jgi:hypothetical protein